MDEAEVMAVKADLDEQLKDAAPNAGIAFGMTLFNEFAKREFLTTEKFGWLGVAFLESHPAYNKHFATPMFGMPENGFKIGKAPASE